MNKLLDQFLTDFAAARMEQEYGIPAHRTWPVGKETCPRIPPTAEEMERAHAEIEEREPERWDGMS